MKGPPKPRRPPPSKAAKALWKGTSMPRTNVASGSRKRKPCWAPAKNGYRLRRIPMPSGKSAIAAGLAAHLCAIFFPTMPHELSAGLGIVVGLLLRWCCPPALTFVSAMVVPIAAWVSPTAAEAIGHLDRTYLPTLVGILSLAAVQLVGSIVYKRSSYELVVPRVWIPRRISATSMKAV